MGNSSNPDFTLIPSTTALPELAPAQSSIPNRRTGWKSTGSTSSPPPPFWPPSTPQWWNGGKERLFFFHLSPASPEHPCQPPTALPRRLFMAFGKIFSTKHLVPVSPFTLSAQASSTPLSSKISFSAKSLPNKYGAPCSRPACPSHNPLSPPVKSLPAFNGEKNTSSFPSGLRCALFSFAAFLPSAGTS